MYRGIQLSWLPNAARFVAGAALALLLSVSQVPSVHAQECSLRVGWTTYEPFQIPGAKGSPTGLDVEMFQKILENTDCTISKFRQAPWTRLLIEVEQGRVDVVLSASYTDKRNLFGRYSKSHRSVRYVAFYHSEEIIPENTRSIDEVMGTNILVGIFRSAYLPDFIQAKVDEAAKNNLVHAENGFDELFYLLERDRLDVVIAEVADITVNFQKAEQNTNIRGVEIEGSEDKVHFLFSRETVSADIVAHIDEAIENFIGTPEYNALFKKYLGK